MHRFASVGFGFHVRSVPITSGSTPRRVDGPRVALLARSLPLTLWAFALAGVALIGLPPSAGFLAKWLLVSAALATGQWWWVLALAGGGLLTAAYIARVLMVALSSAGPAPALRAPVARSRQWVVLGLALLSTLLGLLAWVPLAVAPLGAAGAR